MDGDTDGAITAGAAITAAISAGRAATITAGATTGITIVGKQEISAALSAALIDPSPR